MWGGTEMFLEVILVDDEPNIIGGMQKLIDWEGLGFTVKAAVRNAKEALKLICGTSFDLVITDIKMPEINGFDFIEQALKLNPKLDFIIMSGHDDFMFAKRAIQLHVKGYLLKPIDEKELISLLKVVSVDILGKKEYMRQQLFHYMHSSNENGEATAGLFSGCGQYCCLMIIADEKDAVIKKEKNDDGAEKIATLIEEFLGAGKKYCIFKENSFSVELVIDDNTLNLKNMSFDSFLNILRRHIRERFDRPVSILSGKRVDSVTVLNKSRESLNDMYNVKFYKGRDVILKYEDCRNIKFSEFTFDYDMDLVQRAIVDCGGEDEIRATVRRFMNAAKEAWLMPGSLKSIIYNIVMYVCNKINELDGEVSHFIYQLSLFSGMKNSTFETASVFMEEIGVKMSMDIVTLKKEKSGDMIEGMLYISRKNFQNENLSIRYFSEKYFVNASYLGQLFKRRVGISFNRYISEIRHEESKRLLRNTNMKIYEIAKSVGYKDANYFAAKFEEKEGVWPTNYRENIKTENE